MALSPLADVLAGASTAIAVGRVVDARAIGCAAVAGLGCFVFGMTTNDLVDRDKDAIHSPQRPIPSGRVTLRAARIQAATAALVALAAAACVSGAAMLCVAAMLTCIAAYDLLPAHGGVGGVALLALIRGLDLALGGIALGAAPVTFVAAAGYAVFIGAIAAFARMEDGEVPFARSIVVRTTGLIAAASFATPMALDILGAAPHRRWLLLGLFVAMAGLARWWHVAGPLVFARRVELGSIRRCVGIGLSGLFAFDAAVAFACGVPWFGGAILVAFVVARAWVRVSPPS